MYGLLLNGILESLRIKYGEEKLLEIRRRAGVGFEPFITDRRYSETIIPRIAAAASDVTGDSEQELMTAFGFEFVSYLQRVDGHELLPVLGRHLRDFLNGLDNLHEYMRYIYPKMSPPSFFCEHETAHGMTLHYRSRRTGYVHYVIGQISHVAKKYYNTDVSVDVISESYSNTNHLLSKSCAVDVVLQLNFDNTAFSEATMESTIDKMDKKSSLVKENGQVKKMADKLLNSNEIYSEIMKCPFHAANQAKNLSQAQKSKSMSNSFTDEQNFKQISSVSRNINTDKKIESYHSKVKSNTSLSARLSEEFTCNKAAFKSNGNVFTKETKLNGLNIKLNLSNGLNKDDNIIANVNNNFSAINKIDSGKPGHALKPLMKNRTKKLDEYSSKDQYNNTEQLKSPNMLSFSKSMPISSELLLNAFPFHILFDDVMVIRHVGFALSSILPNVAGKFLTTAFLLVKPQGLEFDVASILKYTNNIFELKSAHPIKPPTLNIETSTSEQEVEGSNPSITQQSTQSTAVTCSATSNTSAASHRVRSYTITSANGISITSSSNYFKLSRTPVSKDNSTGFPAGTELGDTDIRMESAGNDVSKFNAIMKSFTVPHSLSSINLAASSSSGDVPTHLYLRLKGQMLYVSEWNATIFLATPTIKSLEQLFRCGLYMNDLSMHDYSRDLLLTGLQRSAELNQSLAQEQLKSTKLEESMTQLQEEMQRTDSMLYRMIPRSVADRIRNGESMANTLQIFDSVTILFSDIVGFTMICSLISPMSVVTMLNQAYTQFDLICERHSVYKVETIGDAYMAVAGAPNPTDRHAEDICDMALDMLQCVPNISDPSSNNDHIRIRIGLHSGSVIAGVVGLKMSRYCLFGNTVQTTELMEMHGKAMHVHLTEATKDCLERSQNFKYIFEENLARDWSQWKTYWLKGKEILTSIQSVHVEQFVPTTVPTSREVHRMASC